MLSPTAVPSHPNAPGDLGDHNLPPAHSSSAPEYFLHATQRLNERSRWAMVWMVGFAMLVIATVVALAWYLDHFEQEEELRRRGADAQWLEQSVLFHFRRLEDDVARLSQQAALGHAPTLAQPGKGLHDPQPNGLLWRTPGIILTHTWLTAHAGHNADLPLWREHLQAHPSNRQALNTLLDITTGLRRSSYAGPMRDASGIPGDTLWLAVPYFDGSRLLGNYLVAISIQQTLNTLLPPWFSAQQSVRLVVDGLPDIPHPAPDQVPDSYNTAISLPGADMLLEVSPLGPRSSTVPRVFFMVALLFLLGMLASLLALRQDLRKRRQVQLRLQAEVSLRTAMEQSASVGMRAWDLQGRVLYVNPAFCSMVGYTEKDLIGQKAPFPYWPAEHATHIFAEHQRIMREGTQPQGIEVQFQHRNGQRVDVLIHEAPLRSSDGTHLGWMSSIIDISERKRAQHLAQVQQEKLEASERLVAVGEVASTLAHELNQPLGALSSFANGLVNRLNSASINLAEMQPVVQRMAQLAERAGSVLQRVNAFARRRELKVERVDFTTLVQRTCASAQEGQPLKIQTILPATALWLQGDALLAEHLLANLCSNALAWAAQGSARQPAVHVRLSLHSANLVLEVADTGPGVPPEARGRIFDAFFSTQTNGMGMGLAICRSIVEAHHGSITVGHDAILGGALFTVTLPASPTPPLSP